MIGWKTTWRMLQLQLLDWFWEDTHSLSVWDEPEGNECNEPRVKQLSAAQVIGNVDSGKSTLVGVLTKGGLDDGRGLARAKVGLFVRTVTMSLYVFKLITLIDSDRLWYTLYSDNLNPFSGHGAHTHSFCRPKSRSNLLRCFICKSSRRWKRGIVCTCCPFETDYIHIFEQIEQAISINQVSTHCRTVSQLLESWLVRSSTSLTKRPMAVPAA